jgi:ABC-type lipoprotein release transport system permease subunit
MEFLPRDLRFADRNLAQHPTFATVAAITIALGIGAHTAIFSVVNGVLLRDLPHEQPEQLVRIWSATLAFGGVVLGLCGAAALSRLMASQLYGVEVIDPSIFALVAVVLGAIAMVVTFVPALRAARTDPVMPLHGERR